MAESGYNMECAHPMSLPDPEGKSGKDRITVPCGNCGQCLSNKRNDWSFRLKEEWRDSLTSYFVTFTYNDHNIPKIDIPFGDNDTLTLSVLNKEDIQLFFKRLRKRQEKAKKVSMSEIINKVYRDEWKPIKYYLVGEYGPKTYRPHYHALIFNLYPELVTVLDRRINEETGEINVQCELTNIWNKGFTEIGSVTPGSIHYVTKYFLTKYSDDPLMQTLHEISPQFTLMSRGGKKRKDGTQQHGIGYSYIDRAESFHKADITAFTVISDGYRQNLPRYYREKIYGNNVPAMVEHRLKIKKHYGEIEEKKLRKLGSKYIYLKSENLRKNSELILNQAKKTAKL